MTRRCDFPRDKCIHELFAEQAARTPDAVAVVSEDRQITYRELNEQANQLAHYLQSLGVGTEGLVGLCVERSPEMVVGLLGILKAGGAYVPLDPTYPRERLALMLADAGVKVLLTQESLLAQLPTQATRVVCLDRDAKPLGVKSRENPAPLASAENIAYVIFTSGSAGRPKGCMVTHYNVVRLFQATERWFHFNADDVWTLFHSVAFDFSVWEIWGALIHGGRLVIVPHAVSRSPDAFYRLLVDQKVTVLNQTPSAFTPLMDLEKASGERTEALRLRFVIFGGEALDVRTLQPWFDRHGDSQPQLVNMYGITETTVHVTYRPLTCQDIHESASPIGRAIPDLELYLLDSHGQPVPIGVPGEIFVGGAGVARGYLNRQELTAAKFVSRNLREGPPSRLYRTGDLARWLPDGNLAFLGRLDDQVKLRGFRIELGEIEAVLRQCPGVAQSVVVLREDRPDDKRLVAYYVPEDGSSLSPAGLVRHVHEILPEYMVPSAFVALERLPLTPSGKVDRRELPPPAQDRFDRAAGYVAPRTALEEQLAAIWVEVMGLDRVGIHDNFFDLGGHSLLAMRVAARISMRLDVEFPAAKLFETPTIAALAAEIHSLCSSRRQAPRRTIGRVDREAHRHSRRAVQGSERWRHAHSKTQAQTTQKGTCLPFRLRSHSSDCGSWSNWKETWWPTTCRSRCGCGGLWTPNRCDVRWRRSSRGTNLCGRIFARRTANLCKSSRPRGRWTCLAAICEPCLPARRRWRSPHNDVRNPSGRSISAQISCYEPSCCSWRTRSTCCC